MSSEPPSHYELSAQTIKSIRGQEASQGNKRSVTQGRGDIIGFALECERTGIRGQEGARGKKEFSF